MSSSTASNVVADSHTVPGDHACSLLLVYSSVGSSHTSSSSPTLGDGCLGDGGRDDRVGAQRQVRAVLLDRAQRLHEDAALGQPLADLRTGEVGK